ncbi:MAG: hypothetical protein KGH78_02485 [Candidatus Micrarchaeota archaeon]|nr:hypothetical protein [Candidatus Micrarchaeota archaeon]
MRFKEPPQNRSALRWFVDTLKGSDLQLDIPWATNEHEAAINKAVEEAITLRGTDWEKGIWSKMKPKDKQLALDWISSETVYKALSLYEVESKDIIAKELFYMAWRGHGELGAPFPKVVGLAEVMAEELVADVCKNGPEFTSAIIRIYKNEFTDLMLPSYMLADGDERVAYAAAKAIGNRTGEAARVRLKTVVSYLDGMGNDTSIFSGPFHEVINQARSHLEQMVKEDEFNQAKREDGQKGH